MWFDCRCVTTPIQEEVLFLRNFFWEWVWQTIFYNVCIQPGLYTPYTERVFPLLLFTAADDDDVGGKQG